MLTKTRLLGVNITDERVERVLEYLLNDLKTDQRKLFLITPNPEIIVYANKHSDYKYKLNKADIALPDGIGVFIASGILGRPLKERIPGVDFMEEVCRQIAGKPVSIGLLGGRPGVARRAAECLRLKYPALNIVFVSDEWGREGFAWDASHREKTRNYTRKDAGDDIVPNDVSRSSAIDILFVAFGFPKQEEWIFENFDSLPVKVAMGVGGAFDFISGNIPRAPYLIRAMGFEWLFRLIREPWRFRRQLALVEFVWLVCRELLRKYRKSS